MFLSPFKANLTRIAPLFKENSTQDNRNKTPNKMKYFLDAFALLV